MKKFWWVVVVAALIALTPLLLSCQGAAGPAGAAGAAGPQGATGPAGAPAPVIPGTGLKATISKVEIGADRKPVVTFTIKDDKGQPLKVSDLDGYPSFILTYVKEDPTSKLTQYVAYTVGDAKGATYTFQGKTIQPVLTEVKGRAGVDHRATTPAFPADHPAFKDMGNGTFTYTFSTVLPKSYDRNATHRIGGQITRATRAFVANPTLDFVPAGGEVKLTRQIVTTASCNQCHDPLSAHGGSRQDPAYCVTCHTSQTIDPETGNTVDLKVMTHKIHRGENLPSVQAGQDYLIVGYQQTLFDFGKVLLPQDIRNCTTCHGAPPAGMKAEDYAKLAPNADNYKNKPSAAACGACHDNIDFATGKSTIAGKRDHLGGAQANDNACAACHVADSGKEFDASVVGAHTIPAQSKQLAGLKVEIVRVTSTAPGQIPQVVFSAKDNAGKVVPLSSLASVTFALAGPTTDYVNYRTENAVLANILTGADGNYAYTLSQPISANATGSYAISIQAGRTQTIVGNNGGISQCNGVCL